MNSRKVIGEVMLFVGSDILIILVLTFIQDGAPKALEWAIVFISMGSLLCAVGYCLMKSGRKETVETYDYVLKAARQKGETQFCPKCAGMMSL